MTAPSPSEDRRGPDRAPDHVKMSKGPICDKSLCLVVPGEPTTRCCQRIVPPKHAQTTSPVIHEVAGLQPGGFMRDFDLLEQPWWDRERREA